MSAVTAVVIAGANELPLQAGILLFGLLLWQSAMLFMLFVKVVWLEALLTESIPLGFEVVAVKFVPVPVISVTPSCEPLGALVVMQFIRARSAACTFPFVYSAAKEPETSLTISMFHVVPGEAPYTAVACAVMSKLGIPISGAKASK